MRSRQPCARLLELADRQGVEEFVGDQQHRAVGHVVEALVPGRREGGERALLCKARSGALISTRCRSSAAWKPGTPRVARRASAIRVPRPGPSSTRRTGAAGPSPASARRARRPDSSPNICEISGAVVKSPAAPTGRARAVVAEAGMAERLGHEVGDRDRAGERDAARDQPAELRGHGTGVTRRRAADRRGRPASRRRPAPAATAACPW